MNINQAAGLDPRYDEIMDRQREAQDIKSAIMDEKIGALTKEYFNDVGTFFEWIQGIEIGNDSFYFEAIHHRIKNNKDYDIGYLIKKLFEIFCEEKAIDEVNDET